MRIIKAGTVGFLVLVVGGTLVYLGEPWLESHSAREFAMYGLLFTFALAGYCSARTAKQREFRWGAFWSVVVFVFLIGATWFGSDAIRSRLPLPTRAMGWIGLLLFTFYCGAPIVGAINAEIINEKKKPDAAEVAAEAGQEVVDVIHEIFKHFH